MTGHLKGFVSRVKELNLHGPVFFNVTQNQQKQNVFLNLFKTKNTNFINKIICLLQLLTFFIYAFKINFHNFNYNLINIL